jgi:hypothetical protein
VPGRFNRGGLVLLSSAVLMNRASSWAGQAREILDGETRRSRCHAPGAGRLEPEQRPGWRLFVRSHMNAGQDGFRDKSSKHNRDLIEGH